MTKPLSSLVLVLIFIGLLLGSIALFNEMKTKAEPPQVTEPVNTASVIVDMPAANSVITSPVTITGKARGTWFFEASFPIEIIDSDGKLLGSGIAQAEGEWMTNDYAPFKATITFANTADRGFILLKKDNPSGLPEHDATIAVPVHFAK